MQSPARCCVVWTCWWPNHSAMVDRSTRIASGNLHPFRSCRFKRATGWTTSCSRAPLMSPKLGGGNARRLLASGPEMCVSLRDYARRHSYTASYTCPGTRAAALAPNSVRRGMSDQFGCDDVLERARAARPSGGHDRIATEEMQHEDHFTQVNTRHRGAGARRQSAKPVELLARHRRKGRQPDDQLKSRGNTVSRFSLRSQAQTCRN